MNRMNKDNAFDYKKEVELAKDMKGKTTFKVIGAGLSRTGTMSLATAFKILGLGPVVHGSNIMEDEDLCYRLMDAYDHRATYDFTKLFEGYTSGCDGIVADFTMELAKAYPDAKIVLTYRDPDKWWHSIEYCVNNFVKWPFWIASFWLPIFWLPLKVMYRINRDQIERYGEEVAKSPEFMAARIKEITENIPPKRLLVYQVGKWEPLCKFLNVPVPKEPFPKINDGPTIRKAIMGMIFFGFVCWLALFAFIGYLGYFLIYSQKIEF